jgi:hypothetical protein
MESRRTVPKTVLKILVICLCILIPGLALAADAPDPGKDNDPTFDELGIAIYHHGSIDDDEHSFSGQGIIMHLGASIATGEEVDLHVRLELGLMNLEGDDSGREFSFSPALRLYLYKDTTIRPFFELGVGLVHNNASIEGQGTEVNFLSYGGTGLRFMLGEKASIDAGVRVRHISNGGLDQNNSGLNNFMLMLTFNIPL